MAITYTAGKPLPGLDPPPPTLDTHWGFSAEDFHPEAWPHVGTPDTIAAFQWLEDHVSTPADREALIDLAKAHDMRREFFVAWLRLHGFTGGQAQDRWLEYLTPYDNPRRKVPSHETLLPMAAEHSWASVLPPFKTAEEVAAEAAAAAAQAAAEELDRQAREAAAQAVERAQLRYQPRTATELMDAPPVDWLVRDVLPAGGLGAVYGQPGSGKSFLAIDLCMALARGEQWFGHYVPHAVPVVYVALEGIGGFGQRLKAWSIAHGNAAPPERFRTITEAFDARRDTPDLCKAVRHYGQGQAGLIVIDTLNRSMPGADENSASDMGQLLGQCDEMRRQTGCAVLLIHHAGKDQSKGLRGHSSLTGAVDTAIEVVRDSACADDERSWEIVKSRDGQDGLIERFRLSLIETGVDAYGLPLPSLVVEPLDGPAPKKPKPLPASLQAVKPIFDLLSKENAAVTFAQLYIAFKAECGAQGKAVPKKFNLQRDYAKHFEVPQPGDDTIVSL